MTDTTTVLRPGELHGRTALVTGSSRGIGRAIAVLFAQHGARVAVHGRDRDALAAVHAQIIAAGGAAVPLVGDLTEARQVEQLRRQVLDALGPLDVLVANAGGNPVRPAPVEELSDDDWRATIDANLTATFLTLRAFLPQMKQRGHGSIVTVSSAAARRPNAGAPVPYAVAKSGIEQLTQQVATQAGPYGVRANCLAPDTILTARNQQRIPVDVQERLTGSYPLRRLGTPDDVARAALFLASDASAWITGIVLDVAGGAVLA